MKTRLPLIVVDFETFYDSQYSLSKMTTEEYVRDPRFDVMMVGVIMPDLTRRVMTPEQFKAWVPTVQWDHHAVLAHHAQFDGRILAHHYNVFPGFWYCTLSMGRALHGVNVSGSLKSLMEQYGVGKKGTAVHDMRGRSRASLTPSEWTTYADYCMNDCVGSLALLNRMLEGFPEKELDHIDTTIRMFTEPVFMLDEPAMAAYHGAEESRKAEIFSVLALDRDDLMSDQKFADLLVAHGVVPPTKWSKKQSKEVFAFAKSDPGMQALLEYSEGSEITNAIVQTLAEARLSHKSTINITRSARLINLGKNGAALPVYLRYAGAHTFRWSGGDGMNWQNFERTSKDDPSKGAIRKCILAPPGWRLVVVDSGQIEARVLAWLAEHHELLALFSAGDANPDAVTDVYTTQASRFYGREITKADKTRRSVGKVATLGLGYGLGWVKFAQILAAGPMGAKPIIFTRADADAMGVDVDAFAARKWNNRTCRDVVEDIPSRLPLPERLAHCAVAAFIVDTYRKSNPQICEFWKACEDMLGMMAAMPEGESSDLGPVKIVRHGIVLPSGMTMKYPELHWSEDSEAYVYKNRFGFTKLYGGLICENITQALARVAVSDQIHEMSARGYKVATTTHDEVVLVVPEANADEALAFALKTMKTAPAWATGLPLNAEGSHAARYGDAK